MKSTAHLNGHPIHPMLIPYPFALLTGAVAFDLAATITGRHEWSRTAADMTSAGLGSAAVAAVPGIIDYFGTIPPRTKARRSATQHALCNVSALACFALAASSRDRDRRLSAAGLAASVIGSALLSIGGWLGGELIYHEQVGVLDEASTRLPADSERIELRVARL